MKVKLYKSDETKGRHELQYNITYRMAKFHLAFTALKICPDTQLPTCKGGPILRSTRVNDCHALKKVELVKPRS